MLALRSAESFLIWSLLFRVAEGDTGEVDNLACAVVVAAPFAFPLRIWLMGLGGLFEAVVLLVATEGSEKRPLAPAWVGPSLSEPGWLPKSDESAEVW